MSYIKPHNAITDNELLRSPTENAVYDALALKQDTGNYITQLTGEVTALGPGSASATITNQVVTNSKLAPMLDGTIKGNNSGGSASPSDLTGTAITAMLDVFTPDTGTGGLKGLVPAPTALDSTKYLRGDGTWDTITVPASANPYLSNLSSPTAINASLLFGSDGLSDIGASGANRPNNLYVKTAINLDSLTVSAFVGTDASKNLVSLGSNVATSYLDVFLGDGGSGGIKGLVPAPAAGYAAQNRFLKADGSWSIVSAGMSNPMTTAGDVIVGGVAGTPIRLALGAVDKVLVSDGTTVTYQYAGLGGGAFGTNNIILGRGKPGTLTTGTDNVLFGSSAGNNITTATNSFLVNANLRAANESYEININGYLRVQPAYFSAIGIGHTNALNPYVVSIGSGAGNGAVNRSVSIGRNSGNNAGNSAISIGDGAGGGNGGGLGGTGAISIGAAAQQYNGSVNSIAIGTLAAQGASPSGSGYNTIIGSYAGYNLNTGAFNSVLGAYSLYTSNSKNNCVGIGSYAGYNANTANEFYLDSRSSALGSNALEKTSSLFYGTFNASTPTSQTLRINAQTNLAYGVQIAAKTGATKVTANTTINLYDHYIGVDTATPAVAVTITLPSAATAGAGKLFIVKDEGGSALTYNIIIARNGSDTIEGAASDLTLANNRESAYLVSDGVSNWNRI